MGWRLQIRCHKRNDLPTIKKKNHPTAATKLRGERARLKSSTHWNAWATFLWYSHTYQLVWFLYLSIFGFHFFFSIFLVNYWFLFLSILNSEICRFQSTNHWSELLIKSMIRQHISYTLDSQVMGIKVEYNKYHGQYAKTWLLFISGSLHWFSFS